MKKIALIIPLILTGYMGTAWAGDSPSDAIYGPGMAPAIERVGCHYSRLQLPVGGKLQWHILESCS